MLTDATKTLFEVTIEVSKVIYNNDCAAVPALVEKIYQIDPLTEDGCNSIVDAMNVEAITDLRVSGDGDAYLMLLDALDFVKDKPYLIKMRRLNNALNQRDEPVLKEMIAAAIEAKPLLDPVKNDAVYIGLLVRACSLIRDYDSMDRIRERLGE